ncbi:MAG: flavodoxin family protein [Desulfobacteraceae bacterium]|jgi:multimeric flavodoxin WrbA
MKIICVLGSPRDQGNSSTIVKKFCETAEKKGADIDSYSLNSLNFKGCQGCMTCKVKTERCVVKDDLEKVLDSIYETDILVLASPVYMGGVSGQLKCFIDRTFSFLTPDFKTSPDPSRLPKGKKALVVTTQGAPEGMFKDVPQQLEMLLNRNGFSEVKIIQGCGIRDIGDAEKDASVMDMAVQAAEQLI